MTALRMMRWMRLGFLATGAAAAFTDGFAVGLLSAALRCAAGLVLSAEAGTGTLLLLVKASACWSASRSKGSSTLPTVRLACTVGEVVRLVALFVFWPSALVQTCRLGPACSVLFSWARAACSSFFCTWRLLALARLRLDAFSVCLAFARAAILVYFSF